MICDFCDNSQLEFNFFFSVFKVFIASFEFELIFLRKCRGPIMDIYSLATLISRFNTILPFFVVFDCCFSTKTLEEEEFRTYIDGIILQLHDHFPDASFMVFNFRQGEGKSLISSLLSLHNITTKDYPHQFSGCPLLPLDTICKFLIMCEAWLTADSSSQNIMLMHCESGGWPLLAFMLASLLLYRKQYTGEQRTLEMVYKQGPKELLGLLSPLNPTSSHLRYLQYIGTLTSTLEKQPQIQNPFTLDCLILRAVPNFDGKGCRPIVRVYGKDSSGFVDKSSQMLFSTSKTKKYVKYYQKVQIDSNHYISAFLNDKLFMLSFWFTLILFCLKCKNMTGI